MSHTSDGDTGFNLIEEGTNQYNNGDIEEIRILLEAAIKNGRYDRYYYIGKIYEESGYRAK